MARIRETFGSHANTAHVWAQGEYSRGYSSDRRMFFEDKTIYSYGRHFPIASHTVTLQNERAILFTIASYSVSTSKHISLTQRALRGDVPVFYIPNPTGSTGDNLASFDVAIKRHIADYGKPRIRQATRDALAARIATVIESRNKYGLAFVPKYKIKTVPDNIAELAARMQKEEQATAKRLAKETAARIEDRLKHAERLLNTPRNLWAQKWRDNETVTSEDIRYDTRQIVSNWVMETHGVLLRLKDDKTIITTMGAEFPVSHAKKAFKMIDATRNAKGEWHKNGHTLHLGAFQIDSIDKDGNVKAGCHTVRWPEIALMAERIGLSVHS